MSYESLKQALIQKNEYKIKSILSKDNIEINEDIFILSISNKSNFLFDTYIKKSKNLTPFLVYRGINVSLETNNKYTFSILVHNYEHTEKDIDVYIHSISITEQKEFLDILFNKIKSFKSSNLNFIKICLNFENYTLLNEIIKHMSNTVDITEIWMEENIVDIEKINYLKKLLKINKF